MRMISMVPAIALIAACTSGASGAPVATTVVEPSRLDTPGASYDLTRVEDRTVMTTSILAPVDSVWRVVPGVFLGLDVEPGTLNHTAHVISNTSFVVRRQLGGVNLSRYLDCGSGLTGPAANQLKITMSLVLQVVGDSSGVSTLRTQVNGYGQSEATSDPPVHCATTGALEARIAKMVNEALAARANKR